MYIFHKENLVTLIFIIIIAISISSCLNLNEVADNISDALTKPVTRLMKILTTITITVKANAHIRFE